MNKSYDNVFDKRGNDEFTPISKEGVNNHLNRKVYKSLKLKYLIVIASLVVSTLAISLFFYSAKLDSSTDNNLKLSVPLDTNGWKTFENKLSQVSIQYPPDWTVEKVDVLDTKFYPPSLERKNNYVYLSTRLVPERKGIATRKVKLGDEEVNIYIPIDEYSRNYEITKYMAFLKKGDKNITLNYSSERANNNERIYDTMLSTVEELDPPKWVAYTNEEYGIRFEIPETYMQGFVNSGFDWTQEGMRVIFSDDLTQSDIPLSGIFNPGDLEVYVIEFESKYNVIAENLFKKQLMLYEGEASQELFKEKPTLEFEHVGINGDIPAALHRNTGVFGFAFIQAYVPLNGRRTLMLELAYNTDDESNAIEFFSRLLSTLNIQSDANISNPTPAPGN